MPVLPVSSAAMAVAALLMAAPAALAQSDGARQRPPASQSDGEAAPRTAVPREAPAQAPPPAAPAAAPRATAPAPAAAQSPQNAQRTAQPRSRPARGTPDPQPRVAVPRTAQPAPPVLVPRTIIVGGFPRRVYPYGYGGFGLGYFYYDPYGWQAPARFTGYGYGYPTGEVRLRVQPREAEVYVDGYYAGVVDDFDGLFQGLRLEEGPYMIEMVAPGYEPLEVRIRIQPGRRMTYRGELTPLSE